MRNEPAQDLLSPTARPGAFGRGMKIVVILVAISFVIAGAAWFRGRYLSPGPTPRTTTVTP